MIFKMGVKSLVRQPGKTISFFLLLLFVNLFLVLSVSMRVSSIKLLNSADESFLTIAQLKYKGQSYPDDSEYDASLDELLQGTDTDSLTSRDGVRSFERYVRLRGYIENYGTKADKYFIGRTAILFKVTEDGRCILQKGYSEKVHVVEGAYFNFNMEGFKDVRNYGLKKNHYYIAYGDYEQYYGNCVFTPRVFYTNQMKLNPSQFTQVFNLMDRVPQIDYRFFLTPRYLTGDDEMDNFKAMAERVYSNIYAFSDKGPFIDVTKDPDQFSKCYFNEEWVKEQDAIWEDVAADSYRTDFDWKNVLYAVIRSGEVISESIDVVMTENPEYQPIFHQHLSPVTDGRFYEKADGSDVCLISSILARNAGVTVGDTIHIDLQNAAKGDDHYNSYFYGSGFLQSGDFKILGIYEYTDDTVDTIYIPWQKDKGTASVLLHYPELPSYSNTYTVGTFILENEGAAEFATNMKGKLAPRTELTVYDQGYINVASPLRSMRDTSMLLIGICIFTGVCIILLYAYIFISKQRQTANTMLNLGTGGAKTMGYLIGGAAIPAFVACIVGACIGYITSDSVLTLAFRWAEAHSSADMSYSTLRTSLESKAFNLDFATNMQVVMLTSAAVFVFSLIVCAVFANSTIIVKSKKGGESFMTKLRRLGMTLRQARRSAVRTPGRSLIVPTVSLAVIILISVFCGVMQNYTDNIDRLYRTIPVEGQFVSLDGLTNDNLLLGGTMLDTLVSRGYIDDINYANSEMYYNVLGKYDKDGDLQGLEEEDTSNYFFMEMFYATVFERSRIVFTTSMDASPEFFGSGVQDISFADGYDMSLFMSDEKVCVIPSGIFPNVKTGDKLHISCAVRSSDGFDFFNIDLTVAGITADPTTKIYAPVKLLAGYGEFANAMENESDEEQKLPSLLIDEKKPYTDSDANEKMKMLRDYNRLSSFSFKLKSGYDVAKLKDYLRGEGYSYPSHIGAVRKSIVIDDSELQNTVNSLLKVRGYLEVLYPVIYAIIIAIAFVVSYLLIRTRVADIAVMRSMGLGKGRTFFVMFAEQILLAVVGAIAGFGIMALIVRSLSAMQIISTVLYVICYAVGLTIAVCALNTVNVLKIMSSKE